MAADWTYRVRPGDNLWDLSERYLRSDIGWEQLQAHNSVDDPYRLPPGSLLRFPVQWLRVDPAKARVVAVRGDVRAQPSARHPASDAEHGMLLGMGGWLETGDRASTTIEFADLSRMLVQANSRVVFDKLSRYGRTGMVDTRLRLLQGRTTNQVTPSRGPASRHIIDTPSATTSVRGTRFRTSAGNATTPDTTELLQGAVHVDSNGTGVLLSPGFGTVAGAGATPGTRVELLPAPVLEDAGTRLQSLPVTVAWSPLDGATGYKVEVVKEEAPDELLFEAETGDTRLRIDDLPPGRHQLLLRGVDHQGLQGHDANRDFVINADPPPPLTLRPRVEETVHQARPRFEWTRPEGATAAVFQIATEPGFDSTLVDTTVKRTKLRPDADLPPGRYYWRLASRDAQDRQGAFGSPLAFVVSDEPPDPGLETEAIRGKVVLNWEEGEPGQRYRVQIARKPDFGKIVVDEVVDVPRLELDRPLGGRWYLRVQAIDDDGYENPFGPTQEARFSCRLCYGAGATAVLLLLAL
ncbi:FecR family protein [Marilutibacter alkalisoli]|uniref:FecR family protein n=1 Tax=Marilutibacter alkalisoli TaxID=2591633 RepID=UPI001FC9254D|nr:FecR domain-containing protein [Lysobacter alkalisoli]